MIRLAEVRGGRIKSIISSANPQYLPAKVKEEAAKAGYSPPKCMASLPL
jgi:hypothetical protein